MIFRRIKAHVAKEDWFAVFIDFLIVVFGVFMGFQVQQWNENRKDKSDAREYVERLAADMETSIERNDFQISTSQTEIQQLDLILRSLEVCELSDEDKPIFAAGIYNMGKYDLPAMLMSTIDELNATGKFQLIGDTKLHRLITETIREYQTTLALDRQFAARTIPSVNYVRSRVRFTLDKHYNRPKIIDPDNAIYKLETLCEDEIFINAISTVREMTLATDALNQLTRNDQVELLTALKESLGYTETEK